MALSNLLKEKTAAITSMDDSKAKEEIAGCFNASIAKLLLQAISEVRSAAPFP